jgi:hypothetical protein
MTGHRIACPNSPSPSARPGRAVSGSSAAPGASKSSLKKASRRSSTAPRRRRGDLLLSGISACCPARSTTAAPAHHPHQPQLRRRTDHAHPQPVRLSRRPRLQLPRRARRAARPQAVIESGDPAIFTADGPRGPIYQTKMGPIKLAQLTGAPIGAFHLEPEHAWVMKSWDRFLVPQALHAHRGQLGALDARSHRSRRRTVRAEARRAQRRHRTL